MGLAWYVEDEVDDGQTDSSPNAICMAIHPHGLAMMTFAECVLSCTATYPLLELV